MLIASLNTTPDGFCNHDAVIADDDFTAFATAQVRRADRLLLGRNTYELFAAYWPAAARDPQRDALERALGEAIVATPRVVVSRTLTASDWEGTTIVRDPEALPDDGQTLLLGSPSLHSRLLAAGRIDRVTYLIHPIIAGRGARLFADQAEAIAVPELRTMALTTWKSGVRVIEYARDDTA